jgi:hypothetical protein
VSERVCLHRKQPPPPPSSAKRMQLILLGMQNRAFGPYLAAIHGILAPVTAVCALHASQRGCPLTWPTALETFQDAGSLGRAQQDVAPGLKAVSGASTGAWHNPAHGGRVKGRAHCTPGSCVCLSAADLRDGLRTGPGCARAAGGFQQPRASGGVPHDRHPGGRRAAADRGQVCGCGHDVDRSEPCDLKTPQPASPGPRGAVAAHCGQFCGCCRGADRQTHTPWLAPPKAAESMSIAAPLPAGRCGHGVMLLHLQVGPGRLWADPPTPRGCRLRECKELSLIVARRCGRGQRPRRTHVAEGALLSGELERTAAQTTLAWRAHQASFGAANCLAAPLAGSSSGERAEWHLGDWGAHFVLFGPAGARRVGARRPPRRRRRRPRPNRRPRCRRAPTPSRSTCLPRCAACLIRV